MASNKKVCGKCGGMFSARGFMMHETFCKGEKAGDHKTVESEGSIKKCHACGGDQIERVDKFESLNPPAVKRILNAGYTHICNKCGEVLK